MPAHDEVHQLPDPGRVTITVLETQLEALRQVYGGALSDDDCYSAAAITVLLYLDHQAV